MARPTTKAELVAAATTEFDRLWSAVDSVPVGDRERAGACEAWSVKDLLCHLHAWHEMTLGWEQVGSTGGTPTIDDVGPGVVPGPLERGDLPPMRTYSPRDASRGRGPRRSGRT